MFAVDPVTLARAETEAKIDKKVAYQLGLLYLHGDESTPASQDKAQYWLDKASHGYGQESDKAAAQLGYFYLVGENQFPADEKLAERYLAMATSSVTKVGPPEAYYFFAFL